MSGVIETTNLTTDELGGVAEVTGLSPAILAALASRAAVGARGVRVVRGDAATAATTSTLPAVEDLEDPVTIEEIDARLSPAERARHEELAERGYREGLERGYREGYDTGRDDAVRDVAAHTAPALAALERAAATLTERDAVTLAELDAQVTSFALDVVAALVDRELALSTDPGADAIARALRFVPDRGTLVARLNPEDLAVLGSVADLAPGRQIELVSDAGIERGDAVVEVGACRIDAQLGPALARVTEVLALDTTDGGAR